MRTDFVLTISLNDLPEAVRTAIRTAQDAGSLVPLSTSVHSIAAGGIDFVVRVAGAWERKPRATVDSAASGGNSSAGSRADPFLPPFEPGLHVCDLSSTHAILLNKFPVLEDHLLIVTREYASQVESLADADFAAGLRMLQAFDGLLFYNGGPEAGASQPHRHLQLVPLPLAPRAERLVVHSWFEAARIGDDEVGHNPALPFPHAVARIPAHWWSRDPATPDPATPDPAIPDYGNHDPANHGASFRHLYLRLWEHLGEVADGPEPPRPFNLLATREWLWLVPREREGVKGLSVNALGFAGCLLAGDAERLDRLRRIGPLELLTEVCPRFPDDSPA